jgi:hypothetical protein
MATIPETVMQPKMVDAERLAVLRLPAGYVATVLEKIKSAGIIQYHYVMVVFGPDHNICMFTGSEWSSLDPSYKNEPMFGVFDKTGHANYGRCSDWLEPALFVLKSVEIVKDQFSIEDSELCEAEAWAMIQILKRLEELSDEPDSPQKVSLLAAIKQNDSRLAAFMKKNSEIIKTNNNHANVSKKLDSLITNDTENPEDDFEEIKNMTPPDHEAQEKFSDETRTCQEEQTQHLSDFETQAKSLYSQHVDRLMDGEVEKAIDAMRQILAINQYITSEEIAHEYTRHLSELEAQVKSLCEQNVCLLMDGDAEKSASVMKQILSVNRQIVCEKIVGMTSHMIINSIRRIFKRTSVKSQVHRKDSQNFAELKKQVESQCEKYVGHLYEGDTQKAVDTMTRIFDINRKISHEEIINISQSFRSASSSTSKSEKLLPVEEYSNFFSASERAKQLAYEFEQETGVRRIKTGWEVLASNSVSVALSKSIENDYDDYTDSYYDYDQYEAAEELTNELQSYADDWARSEEEGWFYED